MSDTASVKTVILYRKNRVRPETLERICKADHGDMIAVEDSEIEAFLPLAIYVPRFDPAVQEIERRRRDQALEEEKKATAAALLQAKDAPAAGREAAKAAEARVKELRHPAKQAQQKREHELDQAALDELERSIAEG